MKFIINIAIILTTLCFVGVAADGRNGGMSEMTWEVKILRVFSKH